MKYKFDIGDLVAHRHIDVLGLIVARYPNKGYNEMYNRYEVKWLNDNFSTNMDEEETWLCDFEYELEFVEEQCKKET